MGEGHRVRAATGARALAKTLSRTVAPVQIKLPRDDAGRALGAVQQDRFRGAGIACGGGKQAADRAAGIIDPAAHDVLSLHPVQAAGAGHRLHAGGGTCEAQRQIERVNGLRDQYPAAVAGIGAASGLIVIALLAPPRHGNFDQPDLAKRALSQHLREPPRRGAHPVLQDDAQRNMCRLADLDDPGGGLQRALYRLFHQDRLASCSQRLDRLDPRIGRRQHDGKIDIGIGGNLGHGFISFGRALSRLRDLLGESFGALGMARA
ncbi:hypothetical protein DL1_11010 [Thioclava dalianensis]|uniref:Uncharacterized protein n=1 Tax=Thioclava dalianensis TaxID=1185766 RepID=A0A074U952_9RHOB|nr:hypothetical protein DL1_11010 [Thioclava dalianensis]